MLLDAANIKRRRDEYSFYGLTLPRALAAVFCLAVYSEAVSYGFPVFFPVALIFFIWFGLIRGRWTVPVNLGTIFLFGTLAYYVSGMLITGTVYSENKRDLENAIDIILVIPLLFSLDSREIDTFSLAVQKLNASVSAIVALGGIFKFNLTARGSAVNMLSYEDVPPPQGSSLVTDYNFFAFAMLIGVISSLFCFVRSSTIRGKVYYLMTFGVSAVSLALSGSRRGWVTEVIVLGILCCFMLLSVSCFVINLCRPCAHSRGYWRSLVSIVIVICLVGAFLVAYGLPLKDRGIEDQTDMLKERLVTLEEPTEAFAERSQRWEYSLQLLNGYSFRELLVGGGFDYLARFANRFQTDPDEDYPHNPVISAALYSGLLGAVWVTLFLFASGIAYWAHRRENMYFALLYGAGLFFALPSLHTLLSLKVVALLLVTPWLLKPAAPKTCFSRPC